MSNYCLISNSIAFSVISTIICIVVDKICDKDISNITNYGQILTKLDSVLLAYLSSIRTGREYNNLVYC